MKQQQEEVVPSLVPLNATKATINALKDATGGFEIALSDPLAKNRIANSPELQNISSKELSAIKQEERRKISRVREKQNKLIKPSPPLAGIKRTRKEVDYNEGLLDDQSDSDEGFQAPQTSKRLKESEPQARAKYEAKELIDYAAKEKDGHFLRDSV